MGEATAAFVHAGDVHVPPPAMSPVICTSRMKVAVLTTVIGLFQVAPLSVEQVTKSALPVR